MKLDDYIEYMIVTGGDEQSGSDSRSTPPAGQVGCLGSVIATLVVIFLLAMLR